MNGIKATLSLLLLFATGTGCQFLPEAAPVASTQLSCLQDDTGADASLSESAVESTDRAIADEEAIRRAAWVPPDPSEQQSPVLTLADLEGIALRHNPTLSAAGALVQAARGRQVQAGLYPNPVIGYHATEVGNQGTAGQQGGFLSQRFITGGKLELDRAIAGKEIDEAHFRWHAQQQRVLSDVRIRFYESLVAQRRVELTQELARIGDDLVNASETLLSGGQGTQNDVLQAQINADEAHILLDNATNELLEAWRRMAAVTGVPNMQLTPLVGDLEPEGIDLTWETCYAQVLGNHPELNAARKRVERASVVIERAKREPIPDVDLSVSVRHHNVSESDVVNIQLGIPVPVLNRNQGNISAAEAEWIKACHEVRRIELRLQEELAVVWRRYANARQQVVRYSERMVPRAAESLELVKAGYQQGQVEYLTLLTAQKTYVQVNLSYLDALRELRAAASILNGQLLTESLSKHL